MEKKLVTSLFNNGVAVQRKTFEKKIVPKRTKRQSFKPLLKNDGLEINNIELPIHNSFNCGIVKDTQTDGYIIAFRLSDFIYELNYLELENLSAHKIAVCRLNHNLEYIPNTLFVLSEDFIIDPKLIWVDNKLFICVSKINTGVDYVSGSFILDYNTSNEFINVSFFRISPVNLKSRQKNWIPFYDNGKLYFIASIKPHIVYEFDLIQNKIIDKHQTENKLKWIYDEQFLRGNTQPVKLDDNTYLSVFHTVFYEDNIRYYDNGFYVFNSKPPFKPKMISKFSFLYGEMATRPFTYKSYPFKIEVHKDKVLCVFPLGMVKIGDKVLITYGDSDSLIKYCEITIDTIKGMLM